MLIHFIFKFNCHDGVESGKEPSCPTFEPSCPREDTPEAVATFRKSSRGMLATFSCSHARPLLLASIRSSSTCDEIPPPTSPRSCCRTGCEPVVHAGSSSHMWLHKLRFYMLINRTLTTDTTLIHNQVSTHKSILISLSLYNTPCQDQKKR